MIDSSPVWVLDESVIFKLASVQRLVLGAESESHSVASDSFLRPHGLYSPWNSPGQNAGVGSLSLLQGIFPTQGPNSGSPTLQANSLPAEPPGKPCLWKLAKESSRGGRFKDPHPCFKFSSLKFFKEEFAAVKHSEMDDQSLLAFRFS